MPENTPIVLMSVIAVFGVVASVVYYFARYYFKTSDEDTDVAPHLRDVSPPKIEDKKEDVKTAQPEAPKKLVDLKTALGNTRATLIGRIRESLSSKESLSSDDLEALEEILYTSDLGPQTVQRLVEAVGQKIESGDRGNLEVVQNALRDEMISILSADSEWEAIGNELSRGIKEHQPLVWMIVGVNGVGKTTTIGKLAKQAQLAGHKTMVVAGDTFRAAAEDQLKVWSERAGAEIFSPEGVEDPSAVVFDGLKSAQSKGIDVVIVDTAGRLHTQDNLMEQLKKMKRVMTKVMPDSPHETFLVLDANQGQNALIQAKSFHEALELSGVVLTKLDGTAKGGVALGLAYELGLPIKLIGIGEGIEDLRPFRSKEFVESII